MRINKSKVSDLSLMASKSLVTMALNRVVRRETVKSFFKEEVNNMYITSKTKDGVVRRLIQTPDEMLKYARDKYSLTRKEYLETCMHFTSFARDTPRSELLSSLCSTCIGEEIIFRTLKADCKGGNEYLNREEDFSLNCFAIRDDFRDYVRQSCEFKYEESSNEPKAYLKHCFNLYLKGHRADIYDMLNTRGFNINTEDGGTERLENLQGMERELDSNINFRYIASTIHLVNIFLYGVRSENVPMDINGNRLIYDLFSRMKFKRVTDIYNMVNERIYKQMTNSKINKFLSYYDVNPTYGGEYMISLKAHRERLLSVMDIVCMNGNYNPYKSRHYMQVMQRLCSAKDNKNYFKPGSQDDYDSEDRYFTMVKAYGCFFALEKYLEKNGMSIFNVPSEIFRDPRYLNRFSDLNDYLTNYETTKELLREEENIPSKLKSDNLVSNDQAYTQFVSLDILRAIDFGGLKSIMENSRVVRKHKSDRYYHKDDVNILENQCRKLRTLSERCCSMISLNSKYMVKATKLFLTKFKMYHLQQYLKAKGYSDIAELPAEMQGEAKIYIADKVEKEFTPLYDIKLTSTNTSNRDSYYKGNSSPMFISKECKIKYRATRTKDLPKNFGVFIAQLYKEDESKLNVMDVNDSGSLVLRRPTVEDFRNPNLVYDNLRFAGMLWVIVNRLQYAFDNRATTNSDCQMWEEFERINPIINLVLNSQRATIDEVVHVLDDPDISLCLRSLNDLQSVESIMEIFHKVVKIVRPYCEDLDLYRRYLDKELRESFIQFHDKDLQYKKRLEQVSYVICSKPDRSSELTIRYDKDARIYGHYLCNDKEAIAKEYQGNIYYVHERGYLVAPELEAKDAIELNLNILN